MVPRCDGRGLAGLILGALAAFAVNIAVPAQTLLETVACLAIAAYPAGFGHFCLVWTMFLVGIGVASWSVVDLAMLEKTRRVLVECKCKVKEKRKFVTRTREYLCLVVDIEPARIQ